MRIFRSAWSKWCGKNHLNPFNFYIVVTYQRRNRIRWTTAFTSENRFEKSNYYSNTRIFDDITKTFIVDENNRKFFQENNPWALEEMSRRLIEAYQRKLWNPEEGLIGEIQDTYLELEGFLEESMGNNAGDFQGSSIDVVNLNDIETYRQTAAKLHTVKYNKFD